MNCIQMDEKYAKPKPLFSVTTKQNLEGEINTGQ